MKNSLELHLFKGFRAPTTEKVPEQNFQATGKFKKRNLFTAKLQINSVVL